MFVRRVRTASGATAIQVAEKLAGRARIIKHFGSAHTPDQLALLVAQAKEHIQAGQLAFDFDDRAGTNVGSAVTESHSSRLLWQVLQDAWRDYGIGKVIQDEAFKQLVLARLIEPISTLQSVHVLRELGLPSRRVVTVYDIAARFGA